MSPAKPVPRLPFHHFLNYAELTRFVEALAASRPRRVALDSIGRSREGRPIHLLTLTDSSTGKAEDKPAYLIHGNIHAVELSGTHASLYTARRLLTDPAAADLLERVAFHIIPRLNPDGAEFALATAGMIRSRTDRSSREANTLYQEDVNGDDLILTMRIPHPNGPFVADPQDPRLLIRRKHDSSPPFYRTLPEGMIHDWDGTDNIRVEGRAMDWNRNWSYDWRPEPEQGGAGDYPFSEKEMRALAEFIFGRSNLFAVLGYHNGTAAVLRPPSTGSDLDLDAGDVQVLQELAEIGSAHTGFPVVPVVKYRPKGSRDINLRGHFHNFGYHHLGLFVFEFELGNRFNSSGLTTEDIFSAASEREKEAHMRHLLAWWDKRRERDPLFTDWTPLRHPQLGALEIGGIRMKYLANPTIQSLRETAKGTYRFTLEHAARHPRVVIEDVQVVRVDQTTCRIRARVANRGSFPTHISNKGRGLRRLRPVRVEFRPAAGATLLSRTGHQTLGHLAGVTGARDLEWFVQSAGAGQPLCSIRVWGGTGGTAQVDVDCP